MANRESLDSLLGAARASWLHACEAAAVRYQRALEGLSDGGSEVPRRVVFRPPERALSESPPALEMDWVELCPPRWVRPAGLSLSFDCELRQRRDGSWRLHLVRGHSKSWWGARPRHRVEIIFDDRNVGGGEVRFDGDLLRRLGSPMTEGRA